MSKSDYPYAPDEFDVPAAEGAPVGVYRAPRSGWSKTWPFLLVAVIFAGLAIGGVAAISGGFGGTPVADPKPPAAPALGEDTQPEEPPAGEDEVAPEEPSTDDTQTDDAPPEPATDLPALLAAADKGARVRVLNDDGPEGESRVGRDALQAQGFTNVEFAPYPGDSGVAGNTIWHNEDRRETALAVAAALGISEENVKQQTLREGDVMVVVTEPLTPAS